MADVSLPGPCLPSIFAVSSNEEDWTIGGLVEVNERERVEVRRRLRDLEKSCRAKSCSVPERVTEPVGVAVVFIGGVDSLASAGAQSIADPRIEELDQQLATVRVAVIFLKTKVSDLKKAGNKVLREHEKIVKKIWKEAKTVEDRIVAERDVAFCRCPNVSRSICKIVKAADERNVRISDTLTSYNYFLRRGAKLKQSHILLFLLRTDVGFSI